MTKYRLRDQELQRHLDAISGGDFSMQLNEQSLDGLSPDLAVRVPYGGRLGYLWRFVAVFRVDEILIQKEYDPNDWNVFPDVTPPEGVLMRVEARYGFDDSGATYRTCAIFENGAWRSESEGKAAIDHNGFYDVTIDNVKRYRPWE